MKVPAVIPILALAGSASVLASHIESPSSHQNRLITRTLRPRAPPSDDVLDINNYLSRHYDDGDKPVGFKSSDADGQGVKASARADGGDDDSQTPQCKDTIFIGSAANGGSKETGWQSLPQVTGFDLKRDLVVDRKSGAVQPYYELAGRDPSKVKRVLLVQPGLPRDSWKYTNLFRNALVCAAANSSMGVNLEDVIIAGPAWLNVDDAAAGAAQKDDVVFSQGQWAFGALSKGPGDLTVSSYSVLDALTEKYFDRKAYPNLNQIWVAGHSLGGLTVQHYAMTRKPTRDEPNINFWMGNPGSYVWPVDERPATPKNNTCEKDFNTWPYGMQNKDEKDVVVYRRKDMMESAKNVKEEYFSRNVVYALGLEDDGNGDDHCEAHYQGTTHLNRGQNIQDALRSLPGGVPSTHTFDYVPDTSHQDYKMISSPAAMWHLFGENLNVRKPTSGSGSGTTSSSGKNGSGTKNGAGSTTASGSGGTGAGQARFSKVSVGCFAGVALAGALLVGMA
ncbi:hypothetical protein CF327_g3595 [Tilletia walkeri]|uniref:Fungal lipase-like domain-containing protein n=1 Tax=Tilletia walkeri TaxID=117179 RepID=A0A8X7NEZ5_9BASI|nr:hypothetical protein CF327_g3595 [Tilletia walkeri]KAE8271065.1 hypothetical protein A4X09_0g1263 [Tilletia walkeri]